jgi:hypothetical protein
MSLGLAPYASSAFLSKPPMQAPTVSTLPSRSGFNKRPFLGTTRDLRRVIIIMALAGPCRAFDPMDPLVPIPLLHHPNLF